MLFSPSEVFMGKGEPARRKVYVNRQIAIITDTNERATTLVEYHPVLASMIGRPYMRQADEQNQTDTKPVITGGVQDAQDSVRCDIIKHNDCQQVDYHTVMRNGKT